MTTLTFRVGAQTITHDVTSVLAKKQFETLVGHAAKGGLDADEVRAALTRLIVAGVETAATMRLEQMTGRLTKIFDLRTALAERVGMLLKVKAGKDLPAELKATEFRKLFADLDRELAGLRKENKDVFGTSLADDVTTKLRSQAEATRAELAMLTDKKYVDAHGRELRPDTPEHMQQRWLELRQSDPAKYAGAADAPPDWYRKLYDRVMANRRAGSEFERQVLAVLGVDSNGLTMDPGASFLALEKTRLGAKEPVGLRPDQRQTKAFDSFKPDGVYGNPSSLVWGRDYHFVEVKNWADLSNTGNVSAMLSYLEAHPGSRLTLVTRDGRGMSGPLRERLRTLIDKGQVKVKVEVLMGDKHVISTPSQLPSWF